MSNQQERDIAVPNQKKTYAFCPPKLKNGNDPKGINHGKSTYVWISVIKSVLIVRNVHSMSDFFFRAVF